MTRSPGATCLLVDHILLYRRRIEGELDSNALWGSQNRVFAKAEPEFKINAYFYRFSLVALREVKIVLLAAVNLLSFVSSFFFFFFFFDTIIADYSCTPGYETPSFLRPCCLIVRIVPSWICISLCRPHIWRPHQHQHHQHLFLSSFSSSTTMDSSSPCVSFSTSFFLSFRPLSHHIVYPVGIVDFTEQVCHQFHHPSLTSPLIEKCSSSRPAGSL